MAAWISQDPSACVPVRRKDNALPRRRTLDAAQLPAATLERRELPQLRSVQARRTLLRSLHHSHRVRSRLARSESMDDHVATCAAGRSSGFNNQTVVRYFALTASHLLSSRRQRLRLALAIDRLQYATFRCRFACAKTRIGLAGDDTGYARARREYAIVVRCAVCSSDIELPANSPEMCALVAC